MTRDEAKETFKARMSYDRDTGDWSGLSPDGIIAALIEIGVFKPDEPQTATERALHAINYAIDANRNRFVDGKHLISVLDKVGVRIVDK